MFYGRGMKTARGKNYPSECRAYLRRLQLDDAVADSPETLDHQRVVTGNHQLRSPGQFSNPVEGAVHPRQIVKRVERNALLEVAVVMRGVGRDDRLSLRMIHRDDLHPGRVTADLVDADAGNDLACPVDEEQPALVVQAHQRADIVHLDR